MLRTNELYVSQYLDITPLHGDGFGTALAVRQNLAQMGMTPWCVLACTTPVVAWATDALDVHGWAARAGRPPDGLAGDLPSRRRQHEHTLATLQTARSRLEPGERLATSFAGLARGRPPGRHVRRRRPARPAGAGPRPHRGVGPPRGAAAGGARPPSALAAPSGVYDAGRTLAARPMTDAEVEQIWPPPWRAVERGEDGALLSFFTAGDEHVVTQAKEVGTLRPHGTILRTGATAVPDPRSLTVTSWMTGSPLSYLTQGHASNGRVLTTVRGYLGLHRDYGVRVLVEVAGRWRLLDLPSAFSMTLDGARWVHVVEPDGADAGGVLEVRTTAPPTDHVVRLSVHVTSGPDRRMMLALHLATGDDPLPAPRGAATVHERHDGVVVDTADRDHDPEKRDPPRRRRRRPPVRRRPRPMPLAWSRCAPSPCPGLDVEVTVDPTGVAAPRADPDGAAGAGRCRMPGTGGPRSLPCASVPHPRPSRSP